MHKLRLLLPLFALLITLTRVDAAEQRINRDWRFELSDVAQAAQLDYDDSAWRMLDLPHDWAFENGYSEEGAQADRGGYAMGGIGWYRKELQLSKEEIEGRYIFIDFDGVYMNSEVWVNGEYLGKRPYGYISFSYEMTPHLREGGNIIAVRVDNSLEPSARWYHGCGIYGGVRVRNLDKIYFQKDGLTITTPRIEEQSAEVKLSHEIILRDESGKYNVTLDITNSEGDLIATSSHKKQKFTQGLNVVEFSEEVSEPRLWSPESPNLYYAKITISDSRGRIVESYRRHFGFRTIEWDVERGMFLNGEQYKLRGVCEHMEGGPTGAIATKKLLEWRLGLLKNMGCNAIRVAHNPYLPIFYEVCDEVGLLVMDEIFDGWKRKATYDYGMQAFDEWWERDLRDWIRRDKNHPSIFMYSVGNETHNEEVATQLVEVCHQEDPTRLVTSGDCNPRNMDVYGVNGRSEKEQFIETFDPCEFGQPFIATENPHTWQVRGYYRTQTWYRDGSPTPQNGAQQIPNLTEKEIFGYDWTSPSGRSNAKQIFNSSYDNATVRVTARRLIEVLRDKEWFAGSFRWTGYDYVGEAGYVHGGWPFRAFQGGALDLAGFEKDLYYLYQSQWADVDMVHILPHWTHPQMAAGELIPVWVYTSGDEAELIVNGESQGRKRVGAKWNEMQLEWLVPWAEGRVEAVAYRNGVEIARSEQRTAGAPVSLAAELSDSELKADREDIINLTLAQVDNQGTLYPYGENRIHVKCYGGVRVLSFESGSPVDVERNFEADSRCSFFGLNRIFLQSTSDDESQAASLIAAVISGDKKLWSSDKISIDLHEIALRGDLPQRDLSIRYTIDGSEPTIESEAYVEPFSITLGTLVRAVIFDGDQAIISMEERFTEDEGLYWGTPGEDVTGIKGELAIRAKRDKTDEVARAGVRYVSIGKGGSVEWYQENDGSQREVNLEIGYTQPQRNNNTKLQLWVNGVLVENLSFDASSTTKLQTITAKIKIESGGNYIKLVRADETLSPLINNIYLYD